MTAINEPANAQLRSWLDEQLRELYAHAEVAIADTDPEGVHQLRVAVRRLRAALKVAGAGELRSELRWFFGRLGPLRDLDVLLARFRADSDGFSTTELAAVDRLLGGLVADREVARQRAVKTLRGKRYARLLAAIESVTPARPTGDAPETDLVAAIAAPHERLRAAVAALPEEPADKELHELRILGKKLRYAAELAEPAGGKPVRRLVKATKRLQDVLGEFQDSCVAESRLRGLSPADFEEAFVAGRLVERERVVQQDMRSQWHDAYVEVDRRAEELR